MTANNQAGFDPKLVQAIQDAAINNRLSCGEARAIAEKFQVTPEIVGAIANAEKIKIHHCQLGCF